MAYAGITADTVNRESVGSLTLVVATFSAVTSSLWISGLPNAVAYWANGGSAAVSISTSVASASATAGTSGVYFYMTVGGAGGSQSSQLFVLSRV